MPELSTMEILAEIRLILGPRTLISGAAFYSCSATLKKGRFLIVGLNPGGNPEIIKK
jgi:formaldehyde-activating enzyme involved in methanogenesis